MLFAMLSNAGFYTTSGVQDYFFGIVMEDTSAQSLFSTFGAVGSILGLAVIPVMMKFTSRRRKSEKPRWFTTKKNNNITNNNTPLPRQRGVIYTTIQRVNLPATLIYLLLVLHPRPAL